MFVTEIDFESGKYRIPESVDAPNAIADLIPMEEEAILKQILGPALYRDFIEAVCVDPDADPLVLKPDVDIVEPWLSLKNGADYGTDNRYDGLKNFLRPYIVAQWLDRNSSFLTSLGSAEPVQENATQIDSADKISDMWNEFAKFVGNECQKINSFYGYMAASEAPEFENWIFEDPGYKNEFDI